MRILILSNYVNGPGTRRLKEATKSRGHEVEVIDYKKCYCNVEKSKPQVYYLGQPLEGFDAIIPRIAISTQSYGTAIIRQFEMMKVFSTTGSLAIIRCRDKIRSLQLLSRHGIDIPKTVFARSSKRTEDVGQLIDMVGGTPLIVKLARGSLGVGVVLAETRSAAKAIIQAFYSQEVDILVQEFIEESAGADVRVFIVDNKVVGAMERKAPDGEFRSNIHQGGTGYITELTRKEQNIALRSAQIMNLSVAGVDILRSKRGPLVMEVNAFPGLEGIEKATGQDITSQIIKYIEENISKKPKRDKIGA